MEKEFLSTYSGFILLFLMKITAINGNIETTEIVKSVDFKDNYEYKI